jgi:hypothetical protein
VVKSVNEVARYTKIAISIPTYNPENNIWQLFGHKVLDKALYTLSFPFSLI